MDFTGLIYNSFMDLKKNLEKVNNPEIREALKGMTESLEKASADIVVHEDWLSKCEGTLKYIEAAITENRQFIREDGEVLPIEKIKKINKSSVENLAKHSEYITHFPEEDEDIIPDKLYTVEKETDFSVYENKFLYLLLETLKGFLVSVKEGIEEAIESGYTTLNIKKNDRFSDTKNDIKIVIEGRNRSESEMSEHLRHDLERVSALSSAIDSFANTNLMKEMSKFPLISSNITKTNVLRMNENFKACVDLYEFITRYDDLAYDLVLTNERIELSEEDKEELETALIAIETLAYKDSKDKSEDYHKNYVSYLKSLDEEERRKRENRIQEIKNQIKDSGKTDIEYVLLLEDKITDLLNLKNDITKLENENTALKELNQKLNNVINDKNEQISDLNGMKNDLEKKVTELEEKNASLEYRISHKEEEEISKASDFNEMERALEEKKKEEAKLYNEIAELKNQLAIRQEELSSKDATHEKAMEEKNQKITELQASLLAHGIKSLEDYTTEDGYDELEREYYAIKKVYDAEWKKTKKRIKKSLKEGE